MTKKLPMRRRIALFALLLLSLIYHANGHESCCKAKLLQQKENPQYIDDPTDIPPDVDENGEPRLIEDECELIPIDWDEETQGEWKATLMENPGYNWKPRRILNPKYIPPMSFTEKLTSEISAALPWVTLGILITGILSHFTNKAFPQLEKTMKSILSPGQGYSILSLGWASLAGLTVPLCSCGALPLCSGLVNGNASLPLPLVLSFLIASQSAGLDSAAITYGLLGPSAAMGRLCGAILLAIAVGLALTTPPYENQSTKYVNHQKKGSDDLCHPAAAPRNILFTWFETAIEIYPTVLSGLVLSTTALHFLPDLTSYDQLWTSSDSQGTMASAADVAKLALPRLAVLASAVPLQLCEHTSVTLAAALQKAGGSPGLAFAFLLSAPAINMPSLLFVWSQRGSMAVLRVSLALVSTALLVSFAIDFTGIDMVAGEMTGEMATMPSWFTESSPYLAASLTLGGLVTKYIGPLISNPRKQEVNGDCCSGTTGKEKAQ